VRVTLDAHDPQRTLERGYALITTGGGDPLATAGAVRVAGDFEVRMADGAVAARVDDRERRPDGHD
jgi:exodeoxyribonuclease VII large subunit